MADSSTWTLRDLIARGIRALLFDMDGVLADTADLHVRAWLATCERFGHRDVTRERVLALFGQTNDLIIAQLLGPRADGAAVAEAKEALYRELAHGQLTPYRHVDEAVRTARQRALLLAIGTSGPIENVRLVVRELRLEDQFDRIVDRAQFARGKPAPDVFLEAARQLAVPPPQCAVFEDSVHGLRAARAAGMLVIGVEGTLTAAGLAEHADLIVTDFRAIC